MAKLAYERKNGFLLLIVGFIMAALFIYFAMGRPSLGGNFLSQVDDSTALKELVSIRANAGMEEGFAPVGIKMEEYISEVSVLRGKVSNSAATKVIDAELSSAKSYYYLLRALEQANTISRKNPNCNGAEVKESLALCDSSIREADAAIEKINLLGANEITNLRESQLEAVQENKALAEELKAQINDIC